MKLFQNLLSYVVALCVFLTFADASLFNFWRFPRSAVKGLSDWNKNRVQRYNVRRHSVNRWKPARKNSVWWDDDDDDSKEDDDNSYEFVRKYNYVGRRRRFSFDDDSDEY